MTDKPRRQMENDMETVMKARIGTLIGPVNTFLQDIVGQLPDPEKCNVDKYANCWMKQPTWKRREMIQGDFDGGLFLWDYSKAYDPSSPCATESGCAWGADMRYGNMRT